VPRARTARDDARSNNAFDPEDRARRREAAIMMMCVWARFQHDVWVAWISSRQK
jgi:hypothetical protein